MVHTTDALDMSNIQTSMNLVFPNSNADKAVYPLTVKKIATEQQDNHILQNFATKDKYTIQLVENRKILCKNN